jgi:hypothetical protein
VPFTLHPKNILLPQSYGNQSFPSENANRRNLIDQTAVDALAGFQIDNTVNCVAFPWFRRGGPEAAVEGSEIAFLNAQHIRRILSRDAIFMAMQDQRKRLKFRIGTGKSAYVLS